MGERVDLVKHLANHVGCIYAEGEKRSVKGDGLGPFVGLELRDTQRMNMVIEITDNLLTSVITLVNFARKPESG